MQVSLRERAYAHIRSMIELGHLGPGDQLSHRGLAEELGISFTPVREAINQLSHEGIVECHARRGTFVPVLSRKEVVELYDLREAIESHLLRSLAGKLSESDFEELQQYSDRGKAIVAELQQHGESSWDAEQTQRWILADAAFHMTLLCVTGNRRGVKAVSDLQLMAYTFGHQDKTPSLDDLRHVCETHDQLIEALRSSDAEVVERIAGEHIRFACERALKAFDRGDWQRVAGSTPGLDLPEAVYRRLRRLENDY